MNKFLTLTAEQRRAVFERVGVNVGSSTKLKMAKKCDFSCISRKKSVPLHTNCNK